MSNDLSTINHFSSLHHETVTNAEKAVSKDTFNVEESTTHDPSLGQEFPQKDTHQFLRFKLFPDNTVLLSMEHLSEVLTIPIEQVVPIPGMSAWVMGIYNLRGDVLWVSDLSHFLEFLPWHQQTTCVATYTIVVLNILNVEIDDDISTSMQAKKIGLIVKQTEDIEWCNPNDIQASLVSDISSNLSQFLQGYWLKPNGEMLAVLDGEMILEGMSNP